MFYPNRIFIEQWKLFIIEPNLDDIKNFVSEKINSDKNTQDDIDNINNIMYLLDSKFNEISKEKIM